MLNNIIIGMCGVNFTLFGCEEKILSNVHIVQCTGYQCTRCIKKTKTKSAMLPTSLMSFFLRHGTPGHYSTNFEENVDGTVEHFDVYGEVESFTFIF